VANLLEKTVTLIDRLTETGGRAIALLNVAMVVIMCLLVLLRYALNNSSVALQESAMYLHAIIFMSCMGYTLKHDEHVRVDIIYQRLSVRGKAMINLAGSIFLLLPLLAFIAWYSYPYVQSAWKILEVSQESAGLPYVYLLKALILLMTVTLAMQGLAEVLRNIIALRHPEKMNDINTRKPAVINKESLPG
jgi:TRAP-type mannitol/chloroaromatic compound transport system permease small subunit